MLEIISGMIVVHSHLRKCSIHGDPRLRLCAITDDLRDGTDGLVARAQAAERGGASMVLLRSETCGCPLHWWKSVRALVRALTIPVMVSERLDVALACGAAGVHLTSCSMPVSHPATCRGGFLIGGSVSAAADLDSVAGCRLRHDRSGVRCGGCVAWDPEGLRRLTAACGSARDRDRRDRGGHPRPRCEPPARREWRPSEPCSALTIQGLRPRHLSRRCSASRGLCAGGAAHRTMSGVETTQPLITR